MVALYAFYALPFVSYDTAIEPITGTPYNPVSVTADGFGFFTQMSVLMIITTLICVAVLIFTSFVASKPSSVLRRRRTIYTMIGMSVLSMLIYVGVVISNNTSFVAFDTIDVGFWFYLLGLGTVIIGSIVGLRTISSSLQQEGQLPPIQTPRRQ